MFALFKFFSKTQNDSTRRSERAQGLLEFGLILPLLLLFLLGVVEVGRMLAIYSSVSSASRQAARYGAVAGEAGNGDAFYLDCAGMRRKAQATSFLQPLADSDIAIRYDHGLITQTIGVCATSAVSPTLSQSIQDGDRVVISITTTYRPLVPIVPLPPLPMTFQAAHTIFTTIVGPTATPLLNPDLKITKEGSPGSILATDPDTLTYTLRVTNTAPLVGLGVPARNVVVTDTLATGTTMDTPAPAGTGWTCTVSGLVVKCTLPFLGSGNAAAPITIHVHVPRTPGSLVNTAKVGSSLPDANTSDNTATATTFIDSWVDLQLQKTSVVNPVIAGTNITYELSVKNLNWISAATQRVTDTLPVSTTYVSATSSDGSWNCSGTTTVICTRGAVLLAGSTAPTITIVVLAPIPGQIPACSCVINTASATSNVGDPYLSNNTNITNSTDISTLADLVMSKTGPSTAIGGSTYTYNLHVHNNGPSVATSVIVSDTVPAGATIISPAPAGSGWSCPAPVGNLVTCTYTPVLAVGTNTPDIVITFRPPVADVTLVNTASVTSSQPDPSPGNESASVTTTVTSCHPELVNAGRSSISASPTDVQANNSSTSRVTITLRDGCGVQLSTANPQQVTLTSSRGFPPDTVTLASGFSNPTSNGQIAFDVKSTTAGTSTYSAVTHDTVNGANPDVTVSSAAVNFYGCIGLSEVPLGNSNQQFLTFTASNATGISRRLTDLSLSWPGPGNSGLGNGSKFQKVKIAGSDIWSGGNNSNPFVVNSSGWIAGTDTLRTLTNGTSQALRIETNFGVTGSPANYSLTTTWDNGSGGFVCTVTLAFSH